MIGGYRYYLDNIAEIFGARRFRGWGRKRTGRFAMWCHERFGGELTLLEDGFIRSVGLGDSPSFSIVEDDVGIYYDATQPSRLENLLNSHDFDTDEALMAKAREAMALIREYRISKYNHAPDIAEGFFPEDGRKRVLVVAQTAGDASLTYGLAGRFTTDEMIDAAVAENPGAAVYLKIHPDVLSGNKASDIDIEAARKRCKIIDADVNPLSLLEQFDKVYTKTSQMGFEALLLGKECVCFGMPFYAGWGVTDDRAGCERRKRKLSVEEIFAAAYILYSRYYNPYSKKPSDIIDTIRTIAAYKERDKRVDQKAFFFGFSRWKHPFMDPYVGNIASVRFINPIFGKGHLDKALRRGLDEESRIYIWGKKAFDEVEAYARRKSIPIWRVEDGFVRSVGLGSDLTQPYSLVMDSRGIYFDPTQESDLEHLLNFHVFTKEETERARHLCRHLAEKRLSKYNNYSDVDLSLPHDKRIVLVPGQVEDDASIRYGAAGMSNQELLKRTRENAPDAYIVFKPHPDVLAGNRGGDVAESEALKYCDRVVTEVSIDSVLEHADEVHTMTSLVGFEAIIRGIRVYTYGLPFYAGWGLSSDAFRCERRKRTLTADQLAAATLLLYPRYIDPKTKELCEVEVTLEGIEAERRRIERSGGSRRVQHMRRFIARKSQLIWRLLSSLSIK
ncbi:capsular polysaccharide biosynthesis protein [Sulfurimonas sp. HSL3-7]|uniref:capsular polysaccharide biosynthesis protein n=1 Tax=Sulfonitrofixus jiaomeiensis TaxID=3131938 RepID=UPI0031F78B97